MNDIPDAPWIKYADTNGMPPDGHEGRDLRYRIEVKETDKSITRETFNDYDSALSFYKECVADDVLIVKFSRIDNDGDTVEMLKYFDREDEE